MSTRTILIPNGELTLEQLIIAIRQLEPDVRSEVVKAILADEMDDRFARLINRLANKTPAIDITDAEINDEVRSP